MEHPQTMIRNDRAMGPTPPAPGDSPVTPPSPPFESPTSPHPLAPPPTRMVSVRNHSIPPPPPWCEPMVNEAPELLFWWILISPNAFLRNDEARRSRDFLSFITSFRWELLNSLRRLLFSLSKTFVFTQNKINANHWCEPPAPPPPPPLSVSFAPLPNESKILAAWWYRVEGK